MPSGMPQNLPHTHHPERRPQAAGPERSRRKDIRLLGSGTTPGTSVGPTGIPSAAKAAKIMLDFAAGLKVPPFQNAVRQNAF
jgi:hypothetical protein